MRYYYNHHRLIKFFDFVCSIPLLALEREYQVRISVSFTSMFDSGSQFVFILCIEDITLQLVFYISQSEDVCTVCQTAQPFCSSLVSFNMRDISKNGVQVVVQVKIDAIGTYPNLPYVIIIISPLRI